MLSTVVHGEEFGPWVCSCQRNGVKAWKNSSCKAVFYPGSSSGTLGGKTDTEMLGRENSDRCML